MQEFFLVCLADRTVCSYSYLYQLLNGMDPRRTSRRISSVSESTLDRLRELAAAAGDRATRAREAAECIRAARGYRWVGLYDVTPSLIAAIAWTGPRGIVGTIDVESDHTDAFGEEDESFLDQCARALEHLWVLESRGASREE
jgi:hypothetical protein